MEKIKEGFEDVWKKRPWIVAHESDKDRALRYFEAGFNFAEKSPELSESSDTNRRFWKKRLPADVYQRLQEYL